VENKFVRIRHQLISVLISDAWGSCRQPRISQKGFFDLEAGQSSQAAYGFCRRELSNQGLKFTHASHSGTTSSPCAGEMPVSLFFSGEFF
jgi:hypothetical protein